MKEFVEKRFRHKLDLQLFAGKDGEDDKDEEDDEDNDDDGNDDPDKNGQSESLDDLIKKNPALKKQFEDTLKKSLGKRLKKFDGIDPDKARELLKKAQEEEDSKKSADDKAREKESELDKKIEKLEHKEKVIAVKEIAIEKGMSPKLVARLIDYSKIKQDDDGEFEIEEALNELGEEFPELFRADDEGDDESDDKGDKKPGQKAHKPGSKQRTNNPKPGDRYAKGRERALARHKKEESK